MRKWIHLKIFNLNLLVKWLLELVKWLLELEILFMDNTLKYKGIYMSYKLGYYKSLLNLEYNDAVQSLIKNMVLH